MNTNYMQVVALSYEEKVKMYRKVKKAKLIEMLIAANEALTQSCFRYLGDPQLKPEHPFCRPMITEDPPPPISLPIVTCQTGTPFDE